MKKKVFSLMMMLLLAFMGVAKAEVVTIGDGTSTTNASPYSSLWGYSFVEQIYTASEIGTAGTINSISFNMQSTDAQTNAIDVFMKNVSRETFASNTDYETVTASDMVFSGTVTFNTGWTTITLDTPFEYDGTSNLLIGMHEYTSGYSTRYFYYTAVTNSMIRFYSDSYNPDPYDLGSYSGNKAVGNPRANIQIDITTEGGQGGGGMEDQLHVKYMDGETEVIDSLNLGVRPINAWMEPFNFTMYSEGYNYNVTVLDFTPSDGMFSVEGEELPFHVRPNQDVELTMATNATVAGVVERQFVAITEGNRAAHIWPVVVEMYEPLCPDVVEVAYDLGTITPGFTYQGVPSQITPTVLHNDYTLPFPEIPEGEDAVYKFKVDNDVIISAHVDEQAENGKVALYTEDFYGEGGPMAHNNYTGLSTSGGAAAAPFEAQIGEGTTTSTYFPFHTLWNYSLAENLFLASELTEAGVTTAPMTSLSWYVSSTTCTTAQNNISIWMANVGDEALTTTSHTTAGMTLVYTGSNILPVAGQWNEFVLNAGSFAWDGHSNILILCQRNNGSWQGSVSWQTHNAGFAGLSYAYNDNNAYDATTQTYTMSTSTTNRQNIIFKGGNREGGDRANRDVVTIGEGTGTTYYFPIDNYFNYSCTEQIYTADEIGTAGTINSISFDYAYGTAYTANNVTMYMKNVSRSAFSSTTDCEPLAASDIVWTGNIAPTAAGWYTFTLDTPFQYDGTSNLLVAFYDGTSGYPGTSYTWRTSTSPGSANMALRYYSDSTNPDPYDLPNYNGGKNYYTYRSNIQLDITPGGGEAGEEGISAGPVITNLGLTPGTYYLVASATQPDYTVYINIDEMPCPAVEAEGFAFNPTPADDEDEVEPGSVTLRWMVPEYATGWRLVFGSTYHPEPGHPQTIMYPEDGSFTTAMANSYTVRNLWNNTNYFWHVEFNNTSCPEGVSSPVWGFTTHLNIPQNLTAEDYTVFNDEQIVLHWNAVVDRTYRMYNVYRDGELIGHTTVNNISNTTYTDGPLPYNMQGYTYYVTAVYDEGESAPSDPVTVKVSGRGNVDGHVYEQDGTTGIANATVTMVGQDEFGVSHTYNFTTNAQGYYSGAVYAGPGYDGQAAKDGYQTAYEPVQGEPIVINYNQTTSPIDYILDENFDPVCSVIAEYYPDSLDPNSPYVKVYWGCGLPGEEIVEDFETGDFSKFDWQVDPTYPWTVTTNNPYEGTYCMKSGGAGVANVVSNMTVTVNIPADGIMSYFGKISCETNWDYGYFFIDGVQKAQYTGTSNWAEKKFDITAGDHTFQWRYTKDGSVNSNDDCFYVDYITFYKRPEPPQPAQPGWHTYAESDFNNAVGSNVGTSRWAYEYPVSLLGSYAGFNLTKVSLFSDNMYSAVGGNYTCTIYQGGNLPMEGTAVSTITVDVPQNMNAWVDFDLTTPVSITGSEKLWVVWTANTHLSNWPAGCCDGLVDEGTWWNPGVEAGYEWEHETYGTWTMRQYFTNRAGQGFYSYASENAPVAVEAPVVAKGAPVMPVKGVETVTATCANPNAVPGARVANANRSLNHYRVYRTNCYQECPFTEENTVLLATVWVPDTVYIDVEWADLPAGVYKWGVGAVYEGNRGEMIEAPINWTEPQIVNNHVGLITRDFASDEATEENEVVVVNNDNAEIVMTNRDMNTRNILFNQAEYVTDPGAMANGADASWIKGSQSTWGPGAQQNLNHFVAEDFTLDAASTINEIEVYAYQTGSSTTSTFTGLYAVIYDGNPMSGGNVIWGDYNTNIMTSTAFTNCYRGSDGQTTATTRPIMSLTASDLNISLAAGTYYLGWGMTGSLTSGPWAQPQAQPVIGNTGEAYQTLDGSTWAVLTDGGTSQPYGCAFMVSGTTNGGGGSGSDNCNQLALPRESETIWSNCLDKDMFIVSDSTTNGVTVNVLLNSADSPEGVTVTFTNYNEAEQEMYPVDPVELDESGFYAYPSFRKGEYHVDVQLDGYEPIEDSVSIWEPTDLRYVMTEIIYGVSDLYVSSTGWAMWGAEGTPGGGGGGGGQGSTFSENFDAGMPAGWTTIDANNDGYNWVLGSQIGGVYLVAGASLAGSGHNASADLICSGSYSNASGQAITPDNYLVSPQVTLAAGSTFSFWACAQDAGYPAEHFGVFVSDNGTSDWTEVQSWTMTAKSGGDVMSIGRGGETRAQGTWYQKSVDLSAFAGQKYIAIRHFSCNDQFILDVDDIELTNGAKDGERHLEYFKVMCTSIDGEPIFNADTEHPFCQVATDELVEGEHYIAKVAAVYSTGMSAWTECEWQYIPCENYTGTVNGVTIEGNEISWDYPGGGVGPTPPGQGDTFSVNFDDSQMPAGWTVIDGGSPAGYGWQIGSTKLGSTGNGHNGSADLILSQSYDNNYGVVYPDNWFISPAVTLANGSTFSLWACGQDASYAGEHFGVFVSTTGTNPSDFTMVQEWTLTAKGERYSGPRGERAQGNWYQKTVDLSAYAGAGRYVAIRHFNCSDMFYLDVDDVELTNGAKSRDTEVIFNGFVTDPGAMANGADASWIKGSQGTYGPGCQLSSSNRVGDVFTLDAATTISEIEVYGYQTGSSTTSTFTALYAQIYDGNPMNGGNVVWGDANANIMTATAFTNCYRGSDGDATGTTRPIMSVTASNLNIQLEAGTYYLVYQLNGTGSSGPWAAPHAEPGIGNTGNGVQYLGSSSSWQNLLDSGNNQSYGCAMKIMGTGGAPVPPPATGEIIGAMIFADGEWVAEVPYPTNTYTYDGEAEEVCVRIIYNGTNDLPEGNIYYSMSCPECEPFIVVPACEPGDPIHAEVLGATDQVRIWWGIEPAAPINEWLYYDNGTYATSVGTNDATATIYWATMFPAASLAPYAGTNLTKVAAFEFASSNTTPKTVTIYLGGTTAPGTAYSTKTYTPSVDGDFEEVILDTPVAIDGTQNLWIVCSQMGTHPAQACADTGDPNNRWISLNGTTWQDLAAAGLPGYGWLLRGYVTNQAKGMVENVAIELPAPVAGTGTLSHTEVVSIPAPMAFLNRAEIVKYNVYRSTEANGNYVQIGEVAEAGQTLYEYFDTPEAPGTYYYQVKAEYDNGCESEAAAAYDDPSHNYVSATVDAVGDNSDNVALYPNPTKGNVTIEAAGMSRITVVSVLGQVVYDTELEADTYTLNMSQFNAGMYMVRVYTESGVTVKRVTVMQ